MIPQRFRHQLLLLTGLWAVVRAYPMMKAIPSSFWEVWVARKLLDYGFWKVKGAVIHLRFSGGRLLHPEHFNYTHHPYPPLWIDTGLYALLGPWGIFAANALLGLGVVLLTLVVLRRWFEARIAFFATALMAVAPTSIFFDINPSTVALGATFWPLGFYLLQRAGEDPAPRRWGRRLAAALFGAGQTNWFALTMTPAFAAAAWGGTGEATERRHRIRAIFMGAALAAIIFGLQIVVYTPDFGAFWNYSRGQAGMLSGGLSRSRMLLAIAVRSVVMIGPALLLGLILGISFLRKNVVVRSHPGRKVFGLYLAVWGLMALLLPRYFQRERTMYEYLVFPCAVFAAMALERFDSRTLRMSLLLLAVLGALYPQAQASLVVVSETSQRLGKMFAERTRPEEIIFTNLVEQEFPFEKWDVGSWSYTMMTADRRMTFGITSRLAWARHMAAYGQDCPDVVFVLDPRREMDPSLKEDLRRKATRIERVHLDVPRQTAGGLAPLRSAYWRVIGQSESAEPKRTTREPSRGLDLELFYLPSLLETPDLVIKELPR